ncbi:MAG: SHOCT domain-containing protein [Deltaproteobacteria bacterium]|nr:SHOCT domain-containing protein [Deltaproteobacteria bacterium]
MIGNGMMGGGMGLWMALAMISWLVLVVGVVLLAVWVVRKFATGAGEKAEESPLDILKKRYARGEISREEYEEKKRDIS